MMDPLILKIVFHQQPLSNNFTSSQILHSCYFDMFIFKKTPTNGLIYKYTSMTRLSQTELYKE